MTDAKDLTVAELEDLVAGLLEDKMMVDRGHVDRETPVGVYGVDSVTRTSLISEIGGKLGVGLDMAAFGDNLTIRQIAERLHEALGAGGVADDTYEPV